MIIMMIQKIIIVITAIMITIKALVMIIGMKFMIENMFYSLKLFRTSFEVSVFKILKSLLNLFQIDDPKNEMVF